MTQAGGRPSATQHWSGAPRPADMRGGLGPAALRAVCAAPVHESLESPIHGQARETFSAPRLGPLQAFLCATV